MVPLGQSIRARQALYAFFFFSYIFLPTPFCTLSRQILQGLACSCGTNGPSGFLQAWLLQAKKPVWLCPALPFFDLTCLALLVCPAPALLPLCGEAPPRVPAPDRVPAARAWQAACLNRSAAALRVEQ